MNRGGHPIQGDNNTHINVNLSANVRKLVAEILHEATARISVAPTDALIFASEVVQHTNACTQHDYDCLFENLILTAGELQKLEQ